MTRFDLLAEVALTVCAVPVNLYFLFYLFRPWWTTPQGRALIIKAAANAWLVDMGLSFALLGDYTGRNVIRVIGFTLFAAGNWYLLAALLGSDRGSVYPPKSWLRRLRGRFRRS